MTRKLFVLIVVTLFFSVSATLAGPLVRKDKGASNNGVGDPFTDCSKPTNPNNCGNFATTSSAGPGGSVITQFVTNTGDFDGTTPGTVVLSDVFTLPGIIAPGAVLTLNFNPSDDNYGVFSCNNGTGGPVAGGGGALTGPCTIGDIDTLAALISESDTATSATFTFLNGAGFPTSWAFYSDPGGLLSFKLTPAGGTTPTPEPGSASLLFVGALAAGLMALKARR